MNDELPEEEKKSGLRLWAWLPWLPLLYVGFMFVWRGEGLGGFFVPLFFYAPISFLIGFIVIRVYQSDPVAKNIASLILFGGPVLAIAANQIEARYRFSSVAEAQEMLREICEENAGVEIYRTAKDVEGVFAMEYREEYSLDNAARNDIPDPWYRYEWDIARYNLVSGFGDGYYFLEEIDGVKDATPMILRTYLEYPEGKKANMLNMRFSKASKMVKKRTLATDSIESKYGWRTQDLTTGDMRKRWISGGTIEIVELTSGETLAKLTNFYLAKGIHSHSNSWAAGGPNGSCNGIPLFSSFIRSVLSPASTLPSEELVRALERG